MSSSLKALAPWGNSVARNLTIKKAGCCAYNKKHNMPFYNNNHKNRYITTKAARELLGLSTTTEITSLKKLRHAYFAAAKKCHPDMKGNKNSTTTEEEEKEHDDAEEETETIDHASLDFLQVTKAYEILQNEITQNNQDLLIMNSITTTEEEEFRIACTNWLGVDAEIVEECKTSPEFRKWLSGRTDAALYWRTFFYQHGGLAPKLRKMAGQITAGDNVHNNNVRPHTTRRKKRK